jgi:hypothetical protein
LQYFFFEAVFVDILEFLGVIFFVLLESAAEYPFSLFHGLLRRMYEQE